MSPQRSSRCPWRCQAVLAEQQFLSNLPTGGDMLLMRRIWPLQMSEVATTPLGVPQHSGSRSCTPPCSCSKQGGILAAFILLLA